MKKVLVLEDESSIRSFIVINLRRAGYEVIEAGTGEEALEMLQQHSDIRVALLDVMLPGIDGFEVPSGQCHRPFKSRFILPYGFQIRILHDSVERMQM